MKPKAQIAELSWDKLQNELADEHGLAIVIGEGAQSTIVAKSNNNSICEHLYASPEFAARCNEDCAKSLENAARTGKTVRVKCHADLNFLAVPMNVEEKKLVAIIGRSFLRSEDYRNAATRAASGDWRQFPTESFFSNVLISASIADLEKLAARFENLSDAEKRALLNAEKTSAKLPEELQGAPEKMAGAQDETVSQNSETAAVPEKTNAPDENFAQSLYQSRADENTGAEKNNSKDVSKDIAERNGAEAAEFSAWRSLFGSLLKLEYRQASSLILEFLGRRYGLLNLAWLARRENTLETRLTGGNFKNQHLRFSIRADDARLLEAAANNTSLDFRERQTDENARGQTIHLFPIVVGGAARGAVIVGDEIADEHIKRRLSRFMRALAPELEILRLRDEITRQSLLSNAVRRFSRNLNSVEAADVWDFAARSCAEIMQSERCSLLVFDEDEQTFAVKAAVGSHAEIVQQENANLGEKVARSVWLAGEPLLVGDAREAGIQIAPAAWKYKTDSFISFPIILDNQKIGILNLTDKVDETPYDESDLQLIETFAPQLAVVLDRTNLKRKAGELERLSVTDSLTGLRNRRYLEERLAEEVKRTQRNGLPMSFLMIDVDEFKAYNDSFTHPEGDKALKIVGQALRATLRGADVAARYGGEEFSILLPQTTLSEAHAIAERIRERVEKTDFPNRQVTISIGIAACSPDLSDAQAIISAADRALYKAKRHGKNNVQIYSEIEDGRRTDNAK